MELKEWQIIYKVTWRFLAPIAVLGVLCATALRFNISKDQKPIGDFILNNDSPSNLLHQSVIQREDT